MRAHDFRRESQTADVERRIARSALRGDRDGRRVPKLRRSNEGVGSAGRGEIVDGRSRELESGAGDARQVLERRP